MNILLFGSTGMLGSYLHDFLKNKHNVKVITRKEYDISSNDIVKLKKLILASGPVDYVINAAGCVPQKVKIHDYFSFISVNTLFPIYLDSLCSKEKIKMIHISSDCVFSGSKGGYSEDDLKDGTDLYSSTTSLGEKLSHSMILRTNIIGEDVSPRCLLEWVRSSNGKTINGFTNVMWNGVTCLELSKVIEYIMTSDQYFTGIKHIFSPRSITKYELIKSIALVYNLNVNINATDDPKCDKTLISGKQWSYVVPDILDQLFEMKIWSLTDDHR